MSLERPVLGAGEVHVWRACLAYPPAGPLHAVLSQDECDRVARFRSEQSRTRFVVAHAALRGVLARYLEAAPTDLRFTKNHYGKPALAGEEVQFNLSHADDMAAIAVTRSSEVGVDIERIRPGVEGEEIARRFFSPREVEAFLALPPGEREAAFFRCWTRKEAFIKAVGEGFSFPLDQFDVAFAPEEPPAILSIRGRSDEASRWTLAEFPVPEGYLAAVAVRATGLRVVCRDWTVTA